MLVMNALSVPINLIGALVTGHFSRGLAFAVAHPEVVQQIALIAATFTFGQFFIFATLAHSGPLFLTLVTTTRKFFSILFSVVYFRHPTKPTQMLGATLVFVGLLTEIYYKYKSRRDAAHRHRE